jgi:hypothetical protein
MDPDSLEPELYAADESGWDWRYHIPVPGTNHTWDVLISRRRWDMAGRTEVYLWRCKREGQPTGEALKAGTYGPTRDDALEAAKAYIAEQEPRTQQ